MTEEIKKAEVSADKSAATAPRAPCKTRQEAGS